MLALDTLFPLHIKQQLPLGTSSQALPPPPSVFRLSFQKCPVAKVFFCLKRVLIIKKRFHVVEIIQIQAEMKTSMRGVGKTCPHARARLLVIWR